MGCAYSQNVADFRHQLRNSPRAFGDIRGTDSRPNATSASNPTSTFASSTQTGGEHIANSQRRSESLSLTAAQSQSQSQSRMGQSQQAHGRNQLLVVPEHENYIRYLARNNARLLIPDLAGKPAGLPIVSRFAKAQTAPYAEKPLNDTSSPTEKVDSLVNLCLKVICRNRANWVGETPSDMAKFAHFPENLYQELYRLLESHNMLALKLLKAFRDCSIAQVDLSNYPMVNDLWVLEIGTFRNLTHLSLANCRNLTDQAFEHAHFASACSGLLSLDLTLCSKLTDASLAPLIPVFVDSLQHLSLASCSAITDLTLSRVLQCSGLVYLDLSKCRKLSKAYLCQLGLLSQLRHLDLSQIPNVDDNVVQALQPRVGLEAIVEAIASSLGRKSVVAIRESVYAKRLGARQHNPHYLQRQQESASRHNMNGNQPSASSDAFPATSSLSRGAYSSSGFSSRTYAPPGYSAHAESGEDGSTGESDGYGSASAPRSKKSKLQPPDCGLSVLETLNVSWTSVGDGACEALVHLPTLRCLDVSNCKFSNAAFNRLFEGLDALEELQARFCGSGKELDLSAISRLHLLRKINLENVPLGKLFPASAKLTSLTELDLTSTECMLPNLSEICPNLRVLKAEGLSMSSKTMREVSKLSCLEELNLCDCMLNEYDFINLKWLSNLKVLDVSHSRVSDFCVKIIASGVVNLEELRMDSVLLTNHALRHLKTLKLLRKLDLFESLEISDEGLFHLSCMESLEALEVCGGKVRDVGVKYLCGLPNLQSLNLSKNSMMTDKSLGYIAEKLFNSLRVLNVSRTGVTPIGLCQLTAMNKLEQLTARGLKVNKSIDSSIIAKLLSEVPTLWYVLT